MFAKKEFINQNRAELRKFYRDIVRVMRCVSKYKHFLLYAISALFSMYTLSAGLPFTASFAYAQNTGTFQITQLLRSETNPSIVAFTVYGTFLKMMWLICTPTKCLSRQNRLTHQNLREPGKFLSGISQLMFFREGITRLSQK